MKYKKGYKYQLTETYRVQIGIRPLLNIVTAYVSLDTEGFLTAKKGYAWDGSSGPAFDTKSSMRASLVHDELYWLFRHGHLSIQYRDKADQIYRDLCIEDGMSRAMAWWRYFALKYFGGAAADSENRKQVYEV